MTPPTSADARARLDTQKNRKLLLVSLAMAGLGLTLVTLGLQRDWGFLAVFWSGVLTLMGGAWVVGLLKGGGVASAACPHCGATISFTNIASARTEQCEKCGEWSAGTQVMAPLAPDHLAEVAVFSLPLPAGKLRWPTDSGGMQRCPVCAEVTTRALEIQATSALGDAFAAISPISMQRVHSLRVPACAAHDDGVMLDTDEDDTGLVLLFRSYPYFLDFVALNSVEPTPIESVAPLTLTAFLADHPRPVELRTPETCPKHQIPVLTAVGWVSRMDLLPSHEWSEHAANNPVCLNLGQHIERPDSGSHERERIAWCPACEVGMARAFGR